MLPVLIVPPIEATVYFIGIQPLTGGQAYTTGDLTQGRGLITISHSSSVITVDGNHTHSDRAPDIKLDGIDVDAPN